VSYFQRNKEVISPYTINETIRRLETGESLTSIAEDLHKHISALSVAVRSATGKKASSKPLFSRKNEKREKAFELIRTGATFSEAACQVGVSRQMISQWCKAANIKPPRISKYSITKAGIDGAVRRLTSGENMESISNSMQINSRDLSFAVRSST